MTPKSESSWGSWHTGPDAKRPCPQDGRWHDVDEAVHLNEQMREYHQACLHASMRRWRESPAPQTERRTAA